MKLVEAGAGFGTGDENSDTEGRTTGRWSRSEHEKFIEGKIWNIYFLNYGV